jgi:hypothetical protein
MADPSHTDPDDKSPRERDLQRRSGAPALGPWVALTLLLMLGAAVYVVSAMLFR